MTTARPFLFKDQPAGGDWTREPWRWACPYTTCDIDPGDDVTSHWDMAYERATRHMQAWHAQAAPARRLAR